MKNDQRVKVAALVVFAVSAFLQIYPLSVHPVRGVSDTQDCLLNTWILGWGHQQLLENPLRFFQANAFYPNANTLSYSEHLFPLTLLSLPVALASSNPILAYNFVFYLCLILNAYAMFLLVRHLTRNAAAGIAAGLIFAFSSPMLQQVAHLQLLAAWFIPLAFLYLYKFFEEGRLKHSVLFALCLTLQALACIYYGLFFLSVLVVVLPVMAILNRDKIDKSLALRFGLPLLGGGLVMLVFSLPYLQLFRHFHFKRTLAAGAEVQNYLAVLPTNNLLGWLLHRLGSYEYFLFPGIAALALVSYLLLKTRGRIPLLPRAVTMAFAIISCLSAFFILLILVTAGGGMKLGSVSFSATNLARPAFILLMTLAVWLVSAAVVFFLRGTQAATELQKQSWLYLLLFLWALFLSIGSGFRILGSTPFNQRFHADWASPFHWFYDLVPGFKGIRVPSRYAVFVLFSVAVLAGMGWTVLAARFRTRKAKTIALVVLVLLINAEYLAIPQKMELVPVGRDVPPTYLWLKDQPGSMAVVELPFFDQIPNEAAYMYFSLFHGKNILNGYSGVIPYSSDYVRAVFADFPSWGSIDILQKLRVKYVIFHAKAWNEQRTATALRRIAKRFRSALRLVQTFRYDLQKPTNMTSFLGEDHVFEVLPPIVRPVPKTKAIELSPEHWTVHTGVKENLAPLLKDGRLDTSWTTGRPKRKGDFLNIVLDDARPVERVELLLGDLPYDWAANIQVNISQNGRQWKMGYPGYSPGEFVDQLVERPRNAVQTIRLMGRKIRFLKIIQKGRGSKYFWSVAEVKIYIAKD